MSIKVKDNKFEKSYAQKRLMKSRYNKKKKNVIKLLKLQIHEYNNDEKTFLHFLIS